MRTRDDLANGTSFLIKLQGESVAKLSRPLPHIERIRQRQDRALERAEAACRYLISLGAREAYVFGSILSRRYRDHSDIDIAVYGLPEEYIYKVEGKIEELLEGSPFDLVYLEESPPHIARRIREEGRKYAVDLH
jgi:predicted nucleotidyltransferase